MTYMELRLQEMQRRNRKELYKCIALMIALLTVLGIAGKCDMEDREQTSAQFRNMTRFNDPMTSLELKHYLNAPRQYSIVLDRGAE